MSEYKLKLIVIRIFSGLFLFLYTGCVSLVEKTGRALDGSAFAEKRVAAYGAGGIELWEMRNKAGERSYIIMLNNYPTIKFRGSDVNEQGEFSLVSMDYLGGSPQGWNEFRLDLVGEGKLVFDGTNAVISVHHDSVEPIQISFARIKRYDTRLSGNEALTSLRNRHERIKVITEWMNGREPPPKEMKIENFDRFWKPKLFPEAVSKKQRPADWQQAGDQWSRAEGIRWNKGYTERAFPEELRDIRNTGTMLRDWEEALDWIYNEYEWGQILETLGRETVLMKKK